jgi:hypothetical protein
MMAERDGQREIVAWTSLCSTGSDAAGPICSSSLEIGNGLARHEPEKG